MDADAGRALTELLGKAPFPWQTRLLDRFLAGDIPPACTIPTGLGKTAVLAVWLAALTVRRDEAGHSRMPRRLVYVVNRRTVVDQATVEALSLRAALREPRLKDEAARLRALALDPAGDVLAVSTLRGQLADNAEWRMDPGRAAIIIGTVDMIGSRLLFGGYGCGFKSKPLHAGFLGQDSLVVHDEAHLEPAFEALLIALEAEQRRSGDVRPMRRMALTATSRGGNAGAFTLSEEDQAHPEIRRRIDATKRLRFHIPESTVPDAAVELARRHESSSAAVLVYLNSVEHVEKVAAKLPKGRVQRITGTLRGFERDRLAAEDPVFARFLPVPPATAAQGAVYLVCTSAGEVGVNISADHLVCDLAPFDRMAQRLGRVNRFGMGEADVDVVLGPPPKKETPLSVAVDRTKPLLEQLPRIRDGVFDASPLALAALPADERARAFSPTPDIPLVSDILFDKWALTSLCRPVAGRPPVADWLHGVAEWEPPETRVAWREEVEVLGPDAQKNWLLGELLESFPLKPHEQLRDRSDRVAQHLVAIGQRASNALAWLVESSSDIRVIRLAGYDAESLAREIEDVTVILGPSAGGLVSGLLDGNSAASSDVNYDVSCLAIGNEPSPSRLRLWDAERAPAGYRLVHALAVGSTDPDEAEAPRMWRWLVRPRFAEDDGSKSAEREQLLDVHQRDVTGWAEKLVSTAGLGPDDARAVVVAARHHDAGKNRRLWQRSVGNSDYPVKVLAKSAGRMTPFDLGHYRHEFGSMLELTGSPEFEQMSERSRELALHLIGAHHGRARPSFSAEEVGDPERITEAQARHMALAVPLRFARLQRRYGRWGLAYLESLVRVADALASAGRSVDQVSPVEDERR